MEHEQWHIVHFGKLTGHQLLDILKVRADVFVTEQQCFYTDPDEFDSKSFHIWYTTPTGIAAYARVLPPGTRYYEASIGRVLTCFTHRGLGIGKQLMDAALSYCTEHYPTFNIRISAQSYLLDFYKSFGFTEISQEYLEDGIPHVDMMLYR